MVAITGWWADQRVSTSGVASLAAFGTPQLNQILHMTGIPSAEAVNQTQLLYPTGIASLEAFGTPMIGQIINPTAIASLEAFGTPLIDLFLLPTGITSLEAFGTPLIDLFLLPTAIASLEVFGTPNLIQLIQPTGIASEEAFGTAQLNQILYATGIPSDEAVNQTQLAYPTAIASEEAFGTPSLIQLIAPSGIASLEAFGTPQINLNVIPTAIASEEAFGTHNVVGLQAILPSGMTSLEAFGTPQVNKAVAPTGIASLEAFGTAVLLKKINYISSAGSNLTTLTMPSHQSGDLLVMIAFQAGTTIPTLPAGWTNYASNGSRPAYRMATKIAASSSETSGTWTNATALLCHVYRYASALGQGSLFVNSANEPDMPAMTPNNATGQSWAIMACFSDDSSNIAWDAIPGFTQRLNATGVAHEYISMDTNGGITSVAQVDNFADQSVDFFRTLVFEISA